MSKKNVLLNSKKDDHAAEVARLQGNLDQALADGLSANDVLEALQSDEWSPYLKDLTFKATQVETAAEDNDEAVEPEPEEVEVPVKAKKEKKGRTYTVFTLEEKNDQRKLVYKWVSKRPNKITGPEIAKELTAKYPTINPWTVNSLVADLVTGKYLKRLKKKGEKAYYYAPGKKTL